MTAPKPGGSAAAQVAASSALALAVVGSATVATAFGMARYGYGLLLPDIQDDLLLSVSVLGVIGSLAYVTYLLATLLVTPFIERFGEQATVVAGGLLAVSGTLVVAAADGPVLLGAGVATAGASAGLVVAPFGEAVRRLPSVTRARTLSTISCGTGWGVAVAAPMAILAGDAWRLAFLGFAGCAALSTTLAACTLRGRTLAREEPSSEASHGHRRSRPALRMLTAAVLIGLGSATFWTFAVDHVQDAGLDQASGRLLLGIAGVASLAAVAAADIIAHCGARMTFMIAALLEAAAIATIATAADNVIAVLIAAAAFGAAYNTIVAITVLWGTRIYAHRPAGGVAAATGAQGIGLLCGPLTGGILAQTTSLTTALLCGAIVLATASLFAPRRVLLD